VFDAKVIASCPGSASVEDHITVTVLPLIEADVLDQPGLNSTYASGVNPASIVLSLNGVAVTLTISDIPDGKHILYRPQMSELLPHAINTVTIHLRDNANGDASPADDPNTFGNATSPDPFIWVFNLP
jgi:hypothetical protein